MTKTSNRPGNRPSSSGGSDNAVAPNPDRFVNSLEELRPARRRYHEALIFDKLYRFQSLNAREYTEYQQSLQTGSTGEDYNLARGKFMLIALCLVDGHGRRVVANDKVGTLMQMDSATIDKMFMAAQQVGLPPRPDELKKS